MKIDDFQDFFRDDFGFEFHRIFFFGIFEAMEMALSKELLYLAPEDIIHKTKQCGRT